MRIMFDEARNNQLKSVALLALFVGLIGFLGAAIGLFYGSTYFGMALAVLFAIVYSAIVFNTGDSMILSMSGARPVTKQEQPHLYHTIEGLAVAAGIPVPKAYIIDDSALNAFATGRSPKHASITVTSGLLKTMNRQELEGIIGHEMSHIKNYDVRFMMLTAVLVGIVVLLSDFLLRTFLWGGGRKRSEKEGQMVMIMIVVGFALAILTPLVGQLIQLAISRKREYGADASGTILTRYPPGLASALGKIAKDPDPLVDKANQAIVTLICTLQKLSSFVAYCTPISFHNHGNITFDSCHG